MGEKIVLILIIQPNFDIMRLRKKSLNRGIRYKEVTRIAKLTFLGFFPSDELNTINFIDRHVLTSKLIFI